MYISGQCWKLIYEHVIATEEFATTDPEVKAVRTGQTWEVSRNFGFYFFGSVLHALMLALMLMLTLILILMLLTLMLLVLMLTFPLSVGH